MNLLQRIKDKNIFHGKFRLINKTNKKNNK